MTAVSVGDVDDTKELLKLHAMVLLFRVNMQDRETQTCTRIALLGLT